MQHHCWRQAASKRQHSKALQSQQVPSCVSLQITLSSCIGPYFSITGVWRCRMWQWLMLLMPCHTQDSLLHIYRQ